MLPGLNWGEILNCPAGSNNGHGMLSWVSLASYASILPASDAVATYFKYLTDL